MGQLACNRFAINLTPAFFRDIPEMLSGDGGWQKGSERQNHSKIVNDCIQSLRDQPEPISGPD